MKALLVLVLVAAGLACRPGPVARPYPAPAAAELLAAVDAQAAAVRTANLRVRATSYLGGERFRATVEALVDRKGRLRFDAEVSLQGTVAVLTVDGPDFALLDLQKNVLSRGPACPANVASMIRIPLGAGDVAAILLGGVPALEPAARAEARVEWDADGGRDVLVVGAQRIAMRRTGGAWRIEGAQAGPVDRPTWRLRFEDFEGTGGAAVPTVIRFAEGKASFDDGVEIKVKDRTLNQDLAPERFRLTAPPGTQVVEVGCGPA